MSTLSVIFRQKNVIIGAKGSNGNILTDFKDSLVRTWDAVTTKGISVDATVNEEHLTTCDLTENPVEDGAKVTDHVQLNPAELTVEGVISDSPLGYAVIGNVQNLARSVSSVFGGSVRSIDAYNELLQLQKSREPFTVITGLKRYQNMIMEELSVPRTSQTGAAIHFKAVMREIRIVKSKTATNSLSIKPASKNLASPTKDLGSNITDAAKAVGPAAKAGDPNSVQGSFLYRAF